MSEFSLAKNGYDIFEVENYINKLKNDYESRLAEQKDRIFYLKDQVDKLTTSSEGELVATLVKSVERAKQIEMSSKNIYELETKRLQLLYMKMEGVVEDITMSQSPVQIKQDLLKLIEDFKSALNYNISIQNDTSSEYTDPVRRLLSKMSLDRSREPIPPEPRAESQPEFAKGDFKQNSEKPKTSPKPSVVPAPALANLLSDDTAGGANFESIMFKKADNKNNSIVTANLAYPTPNESGFDLKAAVNPTDDLEEIMKAFDFFGDETDKKNKR